METTQGDHPQVPPAKPPDQGDQPNEEVPVSGAHVLNEDMSEDMAAAKNGVSLPVKPASDSGGDHMGTPGGGPEVIAQDHVGAENHGPGETVPPPTPDRGSGMPPKSRNLDKQAKINEAMSAQRSYVCSTKLCLLPKSRNPTKLSIRLQKSRNPPPPVPSSKRK